MKRNPKTGLARKIRGWAQSRRRVFTPLQLNKALEIPEGEERARVWNTLRDFQKRGELERTETGKFRYNHDFYKKVDAPLKFRILKAVYVSISQFAASDIQRLAGTPDRNYVQRIIRDLIARRLIRPVGRRKCLHGRGMERVFAVTERDRFRIEMLN